MSANAVALLVSIGLAALLGAATMHAIVAAFEQLPYARERVLAEARRPDGKPTRAARLARDAAETANGASVVFASLEAVALVSWTLLAWTWGDDLDWPTWAVALTTMACAAAYSLLLVRAVPRQWARSNPEPTLRLLAPVGATLIALWTPVRRIVPALQKPALSEAEDLVEQAQDALEEDDAEMLRSVVGLGDTLTREVMVPRTDMVTIQVGTSARKAMLLFQRSGYSRIPVTGDSTDDVRGVLFLKDVVRATWATPGRLDDAIDTMMREPVWVPESVPVDDLLRRMQDEVFHMAIVVDEYGGVAGLVTIEDALEEIVGELTDEHDRAEPQPEELGPDRYRLPARYSLWDLGELFDLDLEEDDVDTVAGLLAKALGKVPIPGSTATWGPLRLEADRVEGRRKRLSWVVVERIGEEQGEAAEETRTRKRKGGDDD